jgi:hypothetical protein
VSRCEQVHPNGERCHLDAGHDGKHQLDPVRHRCHARGCATPTKPEMLMCLKHWRMVPRPLQRAVWATYRAGQCDDKRPSGEWHDAADAAIRAVAEKEART